VAATQGAGKCSLSVKAKGVGPNSLRYLTRSSAPCVVGRCPRGTHQSAAYTREAGARPVAIL
jgi:hypothetical protein